MRFGAAISSFLLHLGVAVLVYFGLPSFFEPEFDMTQSIAVEIVTVADISNPPPPTPAPKPEPLDKAEIPPPPEPLPEPDPAPPEPEALPEPPPPEPAPKPVVVEAPPLPPEPEPEPEVVAPLPEPEPEVIEPPAPPLKPQRLAALDVEPPPTPPSKPEPPAEKQRFDTLLKDLTESAPKPRAPEPELAQAAPTPSTVTSARDEPLSMTVSDSIRRQVEDKWNVPAGARGAGDLDVEIAISLLPDGTVRKAEIVDRARMAQPGGEYYRSMAESALRAVLQASPLHDLPPDRYEDWREITFRFRPPV